MAAGLTPPYTKDILRLAAGQQHAGTLDHPDARVERRSRTCGSTITLEVRLVDGAVTAIAVDPNACAYGQAAATVMSRHATGKGLGEVEETLAALRGWLEGTREEAPDWPEIDRLDPARSRGGRHGAVLLPFEALRDAIREGSIGG